MISIIIPSFNSEKTLEKCLKSVDKQSWADKEIWVIDGLSRDRTVDIVRQYAVNCPSLHWVSEADKGIYDAMNKGIDKARGEWLFFMGSDDAFHDEYVLEKVFTEKPDENTNALYGNARIVGGTSWAADNAIYDGKFDTAKLLTKNICHQAIFYNTAFIRSSVGYFNLNYRICSDWDFNLRCWAKTNFHYVDLIITDFAGGGASTKDSSDEQFGREYIGNVLSYFNLSPFDKLVNNKKFWQFYHLLPYQRRANPIRYWMNRIQKGVF